MIQLKVEELAEAARVSANTISRFEREEGLMRRATEDAIRRVMEARGAEFSADGMTVTARVSRPDTQDIAA
jgi:transcriptional regulator with XRE-family HTH domain